MVEGIIERAAAMSISWQFARIYSPTSCDRNSYDTVVRSTGKISIFPRSIRILPERLVQMTRQPSPVWRRLTDSNERTWSEIHINIAATTSDYEEHTRWNSVLWFSYSSWSLQNRTLFLWDTRHQLVKIAGLECSVTSVDVKHDVDKNAGECLAPCQRSIFCCENLQSSITLRDM